MALNFSVFSKFKAVDDISKPMRRMRKSVSSFGSSATKDFKRVDKAADGLGKKIKSVAAIGATLLSLQAVTGQLVSAVAVGAEFEQTIVNAAAKFGGAADRGTKNFKALEDAAKQAGKTTEFSSVEAAQGLNFLAMAGFDTKQSIAALPGVIDLATAANVELSMASDMATDTLGAFGLAVKDSTQLQKNLARVTDVMAKTTTSANVDMEQLFETFTEAGPVAIGLGASIETVAAMAGILGNAGIKGSQAGTTLKNVFLKLAAATPEATKRLDQLGVKLKNEKGNFRDVTEILEDVNKGMSGLGDVERAAVLNDIFGKIPIAGVNVLLKTGADGIRKYREELEGATGSSKKMAEMMRDTLTTRFKVFMSTVEGLQLTAFDSISDILSDITLDFTKLIRATDEWVTQNQTAIHDFVMTLVNVAKTLFKTFSVIFGFISANKDMIPTIKILVGLWLAWKVAMIALNVVTGISNALLAANPFGIFVVAVVAVILALRQLYKNWDMIVILFKAGFAFIIDHWKIVVGVLATNPFGLFLLAIAGVIIAIKQIYDNWEVISDFLVSGFDFVGDKISAVFSKIKVWFDDMIGPILEKLKVFDGLGGRIGKSVSNIGESMSKKLSGAGKGVLNFVGLGDDNNDQAPANKIPISPNAGVIESRTESTSRSTVDVNFSNLPVGSEVLQSGNAQGFNLNTGFSGAT